MVKINFEVGEVSLAAETKPDLFSPKGLDQGTKLLLEVMNSSALKYRKALDWGCGWGAIALWLAANRPTADVVAIDSDIAAVAATRQNASDNGLPNVRTIASHGYDEIETETDFDVICSNPPTHRGREVVDTMIRQSVQKLVDGGQLVLVVEARIKPWVAREMTAVFGNYKILKRGPKNVVLMSVKQSTAVL